MSSQRYTFALHWGTYHKKLESFQTKHIPLSKRNAALRIWLRTADGKNGRERKKIISRFTEGQNTSLTICYLIQQRRSQLLLLRENTARLWAGWDSSNEKPFDAREFQKKKNLPFFFFFYRVSSRHHALVALEMRSSIRHFYKPEAALCKLTVKNTCTSNSWFQLYSL